MYFELSLKCQNFLTDCKEVKKQMTTFYIFCYFSSDDPPAPGGEAPFGRARNSGFWQLNCS